MPIKTLKKPSYITPSAGSREIKTILSEIRLLRKEVSLLIPHEEMDGYAHPSRIKKSYEKAIKNYPPS